MKEKDSFAILDKLWSTIEERSKKSSPDDSYVSYLLSKGIEECAKKFGEEAIEVIAASVQKDNRKAVVHEFADVLFHLLVLLKSNKIDPSFIIEELQSREKTSGLQEKRSRKKSK